MSLQVGKTGRKGAGFGNVSLACDAQCRQLTYMQVWAPAHLSPPLHSPAPLSACRFHQFSQQKGNKRPPGLKDRILTVDALRENEYA